MNDDEKRIIPLIKMTENQEGIIHALEGGGQFQTRLQALNIRIGKRVKKISATPFRGPVVIEVERSKVAIGHGMAQKVLVAVSDRKPRP
ncbi:MAG: FeoA family protein [bacterium]